MCLFNWKIRKIPPEHAGGLQMRIKILTAVKQNMAATFAGFDQQLFVQIESPISAR